MQRIHVGSTRNTFTQHTYIKQVTAANWLAYSPQARIVVHCYWPTVTRKNELVIILACIVFQPIALRMLQIFLQQVTHVVDIDKKKTLMLVALRALRLILNFHTKALCCVLPTLRGVAN